jgi:hypothetical protein
MDYFAMERICNGTCNEKAQNCFLAKGTSCDNSKFCDGIDTCNGFGTCLHSGNPCSNLTECYIGCGEDTLCTYSSYGTNCTGNDLCSIYICDGTGPCKSLALSACSSSVQQEESNKTTTIVGSVLGSVMGLLIIGIVACCFT